jgi:hypothetical protein
LLLPRGDRIRYDEVARDFRQHYQATGARNLKEVESRLRRLDHFFIGRKIASISRPDTDD